MALLDAGADGFARDGAGKTPLHCAAQVGHTSIVQALLDSYGFAPQGLPAGRSAAAAPPVAVERASPSSATATQHDDSMVVSIVDARNAYGSTALHRAAFNGRNGVVGALLRGGAGVSVVGKSGRWGFVCFQDRSAFEMKLRLYFSGDCLSLAHNWQLPARARVP